MIKQTQNIDLTQYKYVYQNLIEYFSISNIVAIAIAAASALPEKLPSARAGRRGRQRQRAGRQEAAPANLYSVPAETEEEASPDAGYGAPAEYDDAQASYGAPPVEEEAEDYEEASNELGSSYGAPEEGSGEALAPPEEYDDQASYASDEQSTYNDDQDAAASDAVSDDAAADPLAMLMKSVPGIPGEDYPIFAEAPETAFSCEGQVNGGKIDS